MKIPKKIRIGPHTFRIFVKKEWDDSAHSDGYIDDIKGEITIKEGVIKTRQGEILFHEIFHALNNEIDHPLLDSFSKQVYAVLEQNKMLK